MGPVRRPGEPAPRRRDPLGLNPGRAHPPDTLDVRSRVSGPPAGGLDVHLQASNLLAAPLDGPARAGGQAMLAVDVRLRAGLTATALEPGGEPRPALSRPAAPGRRWPKGTARPGPRSVRPAQPRGRPATGVQADPPVPSPAVSAPPRWVRKRVRQVALDVPGRRVGPRATPVEGRQSVDRSLVAAGGMRRVGRGEARPRVRDRAAEPATRTGSRRRRGRPRADPRRMRERRFGPTRR
jgi:hypothetical protein